MIAPPPPYVMLEGSSGNNFRPPPYRRNVPRYNSDYKKKSGGRSLCRFICCCYCCLFLVIIILALLVVYFYAVYEPEMPSYKVEKLEVKAFDVQPDFSLNTEFLVTVKADNPNSNIGFIYGKDSSVIVMYTDSNLCTGKLPSFHQGEKNTTIMQVDLKGKSEFGSGLQEAYTVNRDNKRIPLLVKVKVPVSVVVGNFPTRQFVVFVNCSLLVDNLAPNKKISIISSNTTFDLKF
ncbi:Late embryogenesis abundant (LEA) hydroxyproline-rich glycoprotein family [Forsythia ovata]|uniref:Late embryogenesis abundant (LEA) hydroxyproline-rich glycoprotein family n=1 Tax=Forsythia ovata TaxID=205694 RepID=A0ABD1NXM5_9LAMI